MPIIVVGDLYDSFNMQSAIGILINIPTRVYGEHMSQINNILIDKFLAFADVIVKLTYFSDHH